jgi:hypothetical protein
MPGFGRAIVAGVALAAGAGAWTTAAGQDSVAVRHLLPLDIGRVTPFARAYDVVVYRGDTATVIGTRNVTLDTGSYAGSPAWLLTEHRTGRVPAAESLYFAWDMRPLYISSWVGPARMAAAFVGDSILGATTVAGTKQNLLLVGRPDLLVSGAMVEMLLALLPLEDRWRDSAAVMSVGLGSSGVHPAELIMLGWESVILDSATARRAKVVALRTAERSSLYWVDDSDGAVLRAHQVLHGHTGSVLEYRARLSAAVAPTPARDP